jgi:hypothetical protein
MISPARGAVLPSRCPECLSCAVRTSGRRSARPTERVMVQSGVTTTRIVGEDAGIDSVLKEPVATGEVP